MLRKIGRITAAAAAALFLAGMTPGCSGGNPTGKGAIQQISAEDYQKKVRADMGKSMSGKDGKKSW